MRLQLRQRLVRLEKAAARRPANDHDELRWQSEQMETYLDAYARQEGAARRRQDIMKNRARNVSLVDVVVSAEQNADITVSLTRTAATEAPAKTSRTAREVAKTRRAGIGGRPLMAVMNEPRLERAIGALLDFLDNAKDLFAEHGPHCR